VTALPAVAAALAIAAAALPALAAGDARRGRAVAIDPEKGNCLICHRMPIPEAPVFGDLGPPLDGVARRLTPAELRRRVADPKQVNPDSIMPAYRRTAGLNRVAPRYQGQPILSPRELDDLVAYLATLKR
jgi:sulfur-oxidizing protein SoxX